MTYKDILNKMTVSDLKALIKKYMSHVKITVTGKKKDELIKHILKHTKLDRDNNIVLEPGDALKLSEKHLHHKSSKSKQFSTEKKLVTLIKEWDIHNDISSGKKPGDEQVAIEKMYQIQKKIGKELRMIDDYDLFEKIKDMISKRHELYINQLSRIGDVYRNHQEWRANGTNY
jgi:hypothetical protein